MSESANWQQYRSKLEQHSASKAPFIPFLGMFLTQVRFRAPRTRIREPWSPDIRPRGPQIVIRINKGDILRFLFPDYSKCLVPSDQTGCHKFKGHFWPRPPPGPAPWPHLPLLPWPLHPAHASPPPEAGGRDPATPTEETIVVSWGDVFSHGNHHSFVSTTLHSNC